MPGTTTANQRRFVPAARVGGAERVWSVKDEEEELEEGAESTEEESSAAPPSGSSESAPLTKSGFPDRRFKGHREDPAPDVSNPEYRRARTGGTAGNMHITIDGKPDRRFKENRGLTRDDVMKQFAEKLAMEYGITKH